MTTVPILPEELTRIEQDSVSAIMLDLRDVSFIDSTGLRAFLQAHGRAKMSGHRLILIGASPSARRLFAVTSSSSTSRSRRVLSASSRGAATRLIRSNSLWLIAMTDVRSLPTRFAIALNHENPEMIL
jgi:anti-anti-sigma factor